MYPSGDSLPTTAATCSLGQYCECIRAATPDQPQHVLDTLPIVSMYPSGDSLPTTAQPQRGAERVMQCIRAATPYQPQPSHRIPPKVLRNVSERRLPDQPQLRCSRVAQCAVQCIRAATPYQPQHIRDVCGFRMVMYPSGDSLPTTACWSQSCHFVQNVSERRLPTNHSRSS